MLQVGPMGQALDTERHLKEENCSASENTWVFLLTAMDLVDTHHNTNKSTAWEIKSSAAWMAQPMQN